MPIYKYQCRECRSVEDRVAGIDDHTVTCSDCGALMGRTCAGDELFLAYSNRLTARPSGRTRAVSAPASRCNKPGSIQRRNINWN